MVRVQYSDCSKVWGSNHRLYSFSSNIYFCIEDLEMKAKSDRMIFEQFVDIPNVENLKKSYYFILGYLTKKMNHSDIEQTVLLLKSTQYKKLVPNALLVHMCIKI